MYKSPSPLRRFYNLLSIDKQEVFGIYIYAIFSGLVTLTLPLGIQAIINLISGGQISTSWIILVVFVIAGVAFTGVMQIMQLTLTENIQQKIFTRSAFEFVYRIPRIPVEEVDKAYFPELVNRFFDTLSVQKGLSKILIDFSSASLQILFGLILLSFYHPFFILFSLVLILIIYLVFRFTTPQGLRTSLVESKYKYEVAHWLEEVARTMETFKLAGNSPIPMEKADDVVAKYLVSRKAHFKTLLLQYLNLVGLKVIIAAGLLVIGGLLVINQQMNIGQFVASEIVIILVLASVEKLILSMETIYDVLTAIEKIGSITDIPLERDSGRKMDLTEEGGFQLDLKDLSYRFKDAKEDIIKDLEIIIQPGEKVCLSGYNSSGKSLLLHIIAGLYDNYSGSITYSGIPLGSWNKGDLHAYIGTSLSKESIFNGSLYDNISLGKPDLSIEQIQNLAEVLGLEEFVRSLPLGYDTVLLPEGKGLPKSIRIKIMLARCLAGRHKLILLEDEFNQLNMKDKEAFLHYLLKQDCTVIAISNDPEVAERFDKIAVLDNGHLIANDTPDQLKKYQWFSKLFQTN